MSEQDAIPGDGARAPFSSPGQGFFTGADRRSHLEQIRHLSQWSRRVLLVTGPRGVGKSTLYRQLSATLDPRAKAARINAALVSGTRDVLNAMVHGFGLAAPADADVALLRDLIAEHAEAQERADRLCVVLIDDADLLESRTLEQLLALTAAAPLRLVVFGEIRLVPGLERAAADSNVDWHEIRLSGFTLDDVRRYLSWRLEERGFTDGLPFTDPQVKEIARLSEGLPGRIDQMANVLLAKIQSGGGGQQPARRQLPAMHQALLAVLIVFLTILYVIWPTGEQVPGSADMERVEVPPPVARQEGRTVPEAGSESQAGREAPEVPAAEPAQQSVDEPPTQDAQEREDPGAEQSPVQPGGRQTDQPQTPAREAPPAAEAEPEAEDLPETETGPEDEALPDTEAEPEDESLPDIEALPEAEPRAEPGPASGERQAPAAPAGAHDAAWIMRQPSSRYTLQLVIFSTDERTSEYLTQQADPSSFARFRIQQDGRILHVVTYGSFESRSEAEQAAASLPASVGSVKPWVRTFGQIQERVRTALQQ